MRFILFLLLIFTGFAVYAGGGDKPRFEDWLADFELSARENGIAPHVIQDAFSDVVAPSEDVLELDHKQPEGTRTFSEYIDGILNAKRIAAAKKERRDHAKLLRKVEAKYGVPAQVLVALWSIESNFGKNQGSFSVIQSLATLAYDGRRSDLFRKELMDALRIMQEEGMSSTELTGSWAGAMGQTQFMPSSYLKFAVDFDKDGKKDIWNTDADALASIANYLKAKGWKRGMKWGIAIQLPEDADIEQWRDERAARPLKEWNALGFRRENGKMLPKTNTMAHLVIPEDLSAAYLVYSNYDVIMDWNHSIYFASSVCLLADAIGKK